MSAVPPEVKAHPDYSDGYFAGLNAEPCSGGSVEYQAGYKAGGNAREIFLGVGMKPSGDSEFRISFTLNGRGETA